MPVRPSKIKAKLAHGDAVHLVTCHLTDPSVCEMVGRMGFDGIWMDAEHHPYSLETAQAMVRAAHLAPGSDVMMRPAKGEFMRMGRILEMGVQGILYPRCDDAEEARQVVRYAKFAPLGERGCDGGNRDMPYCTMDLAEYIQQANAQTFIAVQLETQAAVDQAEAIAAVEGVDLIFFGPGDFSVLEGIAGRFDHPRIDAAIEKIAAAARNTGKDWGLPAGTPQKIEQYLSQGARLICHGADLIFIKDGLQAIQDRLEKLGFTYENTLTAGQSYLEKA